MNRAPAFQFYPGDWLSSPKVALMTPAEEGGYIRLLCYAWADSDCTLPDDDTILANLSRLSEGWHNGSSTILRACFIPHPKKPGRLFNERLLNERKKQDAWRKKSHEGGKRSAESRALKVQTGSRVVQPPFNRTAEPKANSSSASSSSKKKEDIRASRCDVLNGHRASFDRFWSAYPKKRGKGPAEKVWAKLQPDDSLVGEMLNKIDQAKRTPDWTKDRGQFIPHPATWLNAKGWEDDYGTPSITNRIPL
jgi:uncharacterized protein YdaU (DUF1376 family)